MKRLLALSIVLGSLLASCNAVPTSAGDKPFAKEDYAHLYFAGNDIYGMPVLYSDYSSLDRSSFTEPDDVKEIEEIAFDQVFWERVYVASAEEPSVHVPSDGLGNDSSLAADSSLANEAVCQDSGDFRRRSTGYSICHPFRLLAERQVRRLPGDSLRLFLRSDSIVSTFAFDGGEGFALRRPLFCPRD